MESCSCSYSPIYSGTVLRGVLYKFFFFVLGSGHPSIRARNRIEVGVDCAERTFSLRAKCEFLSKPGQRVNFTRVS